MFLCLLLHYCVPTHQEYMQVSNITDTATNTAQLYVENCAHSNLALGMRRSPQYRCNILTQSSTSSSRNDAGHLLELLESFDYDPNPKVVTVFLGRVSARLLYTLYHAMRTIPRVKQCLVRLLVVFTVLTVSTPIKFVRVLLLRHRSLLVDFEQNSQAVVYRKDAIRQVCITSHADTVQRRPAGGGHPSHANNHQ